MENLLESRLEKPFTKWLARGSWAGVVFIPMALSYFCGFILGLICRPFGRQ
ncbi:hypothetical protein [Verminephrobacter eiseniae]|uniref:hypothetical protein n=1 Tax=Verminephrobacter eiseniae TaxID=364317 RepID=UPI0018DD58B5|nr:hypothetical protein [Verminephrobacter eiseniae]